MLLIATIIVLGLTVLLGLVLGSIYLLRDAAPEKTPVIGYLHAALGAAGVICLALALRHASRDLPQGAGNFGTMAGVLAAAALAAGLWVLATRLRGRRVAPALVALHASVGVAAYVILTAYFAYPVSYRALPPVEHTR